MDDAELLAAARVVIRDNVGPDLTAALTTLADGRESVGAAGPGAAAMIALCAEARAALAPFMGPRGRIPCVVREVTPWFGAMLRDAGAPVSAFAGLTVWGSREAEGGPMADAAARRAALEMIARRREVADAIARSFSAGGAREDRDDEAKGEDVAPHLARLGAPEPTRLLGGPHDGRTRGGG